MLRMAGRLKNGKPFVLLGLEERNIELLRKNQPIRVNLKNLDPDGPPVEELPDLDVVIVFARENESEYLMRMMTD